MRLTKEVNISNIMVDNHPINGSTLELVKYLEKGGDVPAVKLSNLGDGSFRLKDGRHRVTAFKLLGRDKILAIFSDDKEKK